MLKHIRDMIATLSKINGKLSRVFDYHEAMGISLTDKDEKALTNSKKKYYANLDYVPLRSVYTSLFSTGLHLQNSLLKVRQLEKIFDLMEKRKYEGDNSNTSKNIKDDSFVSLAGGPSQAEIVQWLKGFEEIQGELNACVGCLDDGVSNIDRLQNIDNDSSKDAIDPSVNKTEHSNNETRNANTNRLPVVPLIDNDDPKQHLDEVFEAVIEGETTDDEGKSNVLRQKQLEDEYMQRKLKSERRLMQELKSVLVEKQVEHEKREALAVARQLGQSEYQEENGHLCDPDNAFLKSLNAPDLMINEMNAEGNDTSTGCNDDTFLQYTDNGEQDKEYCELVINCNRKHLDNHTSVQIQPVLNKTDPFCFNNGGILNKIEMRTGYEITGFEDSFVSPTNSDDNLNNFEDESYVSNDLTYDDYLQNNLKEGTNAASNTSGISSSYTNEETQTNVMFINGFDGTNEIKVNQSGRKYIRHIFEKQIVDENELRSGILDNHCNISDEEEQPSSQDSIRRRSRDLPLLNIEKNYSADESESASDSVSSDQGTVKLKGTLNGRHSQNSIPEEEMSNIRQCLAKNNQPIPRSISGQVLTDDDDVDENSSDDKYEVENDDDPTKCDEIDNKTDSNEESSSSESAESEVESSDDEAKTDKLLKYDDPNTAESLDNDTKNRIYAQSDINGERIAFSSPFESSLTNSISSSEASSFVYNVNPGPSTSNIPVGQVPRAVLPVSMTSSFCSSFCQTRPTDGEINCNLSDIRSVSTPDLKRLALISSTSSPYISLEDLTPKAEDNDRYDNSSDESSTYSDTYNESYLQSSVGDDMVDEGSIHSSTEWGSADDLDHHVLKTYRRPLRPAAATVATDIDAEKHAAKEKKINGYSVTQENLKCNNKIQSQTEKRRAKRHRNQSIILSGNNTAVEVSKLCTDKPVNKEICQPSMQNNSMPHLLEHNTTDIKEEKREEKLYNSILNSATQSVYLTRKQKENGSGPLNISLPRNPLGFDSFLATKVAQKAKHFTAGFSSKTEEVFGDPDSE